MPRDARRFSGLVFMGGPMSVNDDLPWIIPALELVRDAVRKDVPVLGHCLGGQLMSKAFGGAVTANRIKEIGWGEVRVADNGVARAWLGDLPAFESFHWHGETFSIPPGATRILEGEHCANQAFAIGKHLGMQCHVEMTEQLIRDWCRNWEREVSALAARVASVQTPEEMTANLRARVPALHAIADRVYAEWIKGLRT